jgi:hypothetical protein
MSGINPGTNPGNETRIRRLESELQSLTIQTQTMLELLRRNQRYGGGGGGAGVNLVMVRVQENVDATMKQFDATSAKVMLGTGPSVNTEMVIDNMDAGVPDEDAVGNITGPYPDHDDPAEGEQVFVLLKGMYVLTYQGTDGRWNALQAGGGCVTAPAPEPEPEPGP